MEPSQVPHHVILADDQAIFRAGAARVIAREPDMRIIAECDNIHRLAATIAASPGAILLLAQTLGASLEQVNLQAREAGCPVILLMENHVRPEPSALSAVDFALTRNTSSERLLDCIRRVARGQRCLELPLPTPETADSAGLRVREQLTPRELQIVGLVVQGHKNKQVAAELNVQEQVVKNYLRSIYDKTGVSDRLELALFVLHHSVLAEAAARAIASLGLRSS